MWYVSFCDWLRVFLLIKGWIFHLCVYHKIYSALSWILINLLSCKHHYKIDNSSITTPSPHTHKFLPCPPPPACHQLICFLSLFLLCLDGHVKGQFYFFPSNPFASYFFFLPITLAKTSLYWWKKTPLPCSWFQKEGFWCFNAKYDVSQKPRQVDMENTIINWNAERSGMWRAELLEPCPATGQGMPNSVLGTCML